MSYSQYASLKYGFGKTAQDTGEFWRSREFKEAIRGATYTIFGRDHVFGAGKTLEAPKAFIPPPKYIPPGSTAKLTGAFKTPAVGPHPVSTAPTGFNVGATSVTSSYGKKITTPRPETETIYYTPMGGGERVPINLSADAQEYYDAHAGIWGWAYDIGRGLSSGAEETELYGTTENAFREESSLKLIPAVTGALSNAWLFIRMTLLEQDVLNLEDTSKVDRSNIFRIGQTPEERAAEAARKRATLEEVKAEFAVRKAAQYDVWNDLAGANSSLPEGFSEEDLQHMNAPESTEEYYKYKSKYDKARKAEYEKAKVDAQNIWASYEQNDAKMKEIIQSIPAEGAARMTEAFKLSNRAANLERRFSEYGVLHANTEEAQTMMAQLQQEATQKYDEAYNINLRNMLPEQKAVYDEVRRKADRYKNMAVAAMRRGDEKQYQMYEARFRQFDQTAVDMVTRHTWEFQELVRLQQESYVLLKDYYRADAKTDLRNKYGSYTFSTNPEAEDAFYGALAEAQMQVGRELTEDEIQQLKQPFLSASTELIGQAIFDPLNLLDITGLDKVIFEGLGWVIRGVIKGTPPLNSIAKFLGRVTTGTVASRIAADTSDILRRVLKGSDPTYANAKRIVENLGIIVDNAREILKINGVEALEEIYNRAKLKLPELEGITSTEFKRLIDATDHKDIEMAKKISGRNWGAEFEQSTVNWQTKTGNTIGSVLKSQEKNLTAEQVAKRVLEQLMVLQDDERAIVDIISNWAEKFGNNFMDAHKIREGTSLLDDTVMGWLDKRLRLFADMGEEGINPAVASRLKKGDLRAIKMGKASKEWLRTGADVLSSSVEWFHKAGNFLKALWATNVLSTPRYLINNTVDSGFRRLITGGNPFGDLHTLYNSLHAALADEVGVVPYELVQALARTGLDFEQAAPGRLLSGKKFGFFEFWKDAIRESRISRIKNQSGTVLEIYDLTQHSGLKGAFINLWDGLKTGDWLLTYPEAVADFNTAMEFTMRLRMFAEGYTSAMKHLDPQALEATLHMLSPENQKIAKHMWDLAGNNPAKLRAYVNDLTTYIDPKKLTGRKAWSMLVPPEIDSWLKGMGNTDRMLFTADVRRSFDNFVQDTLKTNGKVSKAEVGQFFDDYIDAYMDEVSIRMSNMASESHIGGTLGTDVADMGDFPKPSDLTGSSPMSGGPTIPPQPSRNVRKRGMEIAETFQSDAEPYMKVEFVDDPITVELKINPENKKPYLVVGNAYALDAKEKKIYTELRDRFIEGYANIPENMKVFSDAKIKDRKQFLEYVLKMMDNPADVLAENEKAFWAITNQFNNDEYVREFIEKLTGKNAKFKYNSLEDVLKAGKLATMEDPYIRGFVEFMNAHVEGLHQEIRAIPDFFRIAGNQKASVRAEVWNLIHSETLPDDLAMKLRQFYNRIEVNEASIHKFFLDVYPGPKRIRMGRDKLWTKYWDEGTAAYESALRRDQELLKLIDDGEIEKVIEKLDGALEDIDGFYSRELGINYILDDKGNIQSFTFRGRTFTSPSDVRIAQSTLFGVHVNDPQDVFRIFKRPDQDYVKTLQGALISKANMTPQESQVLSRLVDEHAKWYQQMAGGDPKIYEAFYERLGFKKVKGIWQLPADPHIRIGERLGIDFIERENRLVLFGFDSADNMEDMLAQISNIWYDDMFTLSEINPGLKKEMEAFDKLVVQVSGQGLVGGGKLSEKQREVVGQIFTQYLREGVGDDVRLAKSFRHFKTWLAGTFEPIKGSRFEIEISDEVYALLNKSLNETKASVIPTMNSRKAQVIARQNGLELTDDEILEHVNNYMYHAERSPEFAPTRTRLMDAFKEVGYTDEQSQALLQLMDARARASGMDIPTFYEKNLKAVNALDSLDELERTDALFNSLDPFKEYGSKAANEVFMPLQTQDAMITNSRKNVIDTVIKSKLNITQKVLDESIPEEYRAIIAFYYSSGVVEGPTLAQQGLDTWNKLKTIFKKTPEKYATKKAKAVYQSLEEIMDEATGYKNVLEFLNDKTYLSMEELHKLNQFELLTYSWAVEKTLKGGEDSYNILRRADDMGLSWQELIDKGVVKKPGLKGAYELTKEIGVGQDFINTASKLKRNLADKFSYYKIKSSIYDTFLDGIKKFVPESEWESLFGVTAEEVKKVRSLLHSGSEGAIEFLGDGSTIISIVKGADLSTGIHELGHLFRNSLDPVMTARLEKIVGLAEGEFKTLRPAFEEYRQLKSLTKLSPEQAKRLEEITESALKYEKAEERFANDFVQYVRSGKAPTPALEGVFKKFKNWLKEIFSKVGDVTGKNLTPSMREFMDDLFRFDEPKFGIYDSLDNVSEDLIRKTFQFDADEKWNETLGEAWNVWKQNRNYVGFPDEVMTSPQRLREYLLMKERNMSDDVADTYRRLRVDLERFENGMLNYHYGDDMYKHLFPVVNQTLLGAPMKTFVRNSDSLINNQEAALEALRKWKEYAKELVENDGIMYRELDNASRLQLNAWADEAVKSKGELVKKVVDQSVKRTNDVMLDYATRTRFDDFMRNVFPFWMFPSRSWPFWVKTMAEHPAITAAYGKIYDASETMRRQAKMVDSRGNLLESYDGRFQIPGTDLWINPIHGISATYILDSVMHPNAPELNSEGDPAEPTAYIVEHFLKNSSVYGFSVAPWIAYSMKLFGGVSNDALPAFPSSPLIPLMPRWMPKELEYRLSQIPWLSPGFASAVGATTDLFYPEVPWHDYLVETEMLSELNELINNPDISAQDKWTATQRFKSILQYRRNGNPDSQWDEVAEWNSYYKKITGDEAFRNLMSVATSFYPKPYTDGRAELLAIRNRHNMLTRAINDKMSAAIFNLPVDDQDIWDIYIANKNTPEGWVYSMYSRLGYVRNAEGELVTDPQERADAISGGLDAEDFQIKYWQGMNSLEYTLQESLKALPIGAPYEDVKPLYDAFFEGAQALKSQFLITKYEMINGTNKTADQIQETWRREFWTQMRESRPQWDIENGQKYEDYKLSMDIWRLNMTNLASSLMPKFSEARLPLMGKLKEDQMFDFDGFMQQLIAEATPEGYDAWKRANDDVFDALNAAYDQVYWNAYWDSGVLDGGYEAQIAAREFFSQFPDGYPSTDQLYEAVTEIYGDRFTYDDVKKWAEYSGEHPLTIDEQMVQRHGEMYPKKQEIWRMLTALGPGRANADLIQIGQLIESEKGQFNTLVKTWYDTIGYGYDKQPEKIELLYSMLKEASDYLGIQDPTNEKMREFIEAQKLNEDFKQIVTEELGGDFYNATLGYYYSMDREEMALIRRYVPEKIKDSKRYFQLKDEFAKNNPLWRAYYVDPVPTKKLGAEFLKGEKASEKATSPNRPEENPELPPTWQDKRDQRKARNAKNGPSAPPPAPTIQADIGFSFSTQSPLRWPSGMQGTISPQLEYEITSAYNYGQPLSGSAQSYLNDLYMNHPEWRGFIRYIFATLGT